MLFQAGQNAAADAIADLITAVSLHTASPGNAGTANEVSGGSYARSTVTGSGWTESSGVASNNAKVAFADATADWGTVAYFMCWGSSSTAIAGGALTTSRNIVSGTTDIEFAIGDLTITIPAGTF